MAGFQQVKVMRSLQVGLTGAVATKITQIRIYSQAIAPTSVAANTVAAQTFTVTGLATTDKVLVNPGVATIGVAGAYVSAANTLSVIFVNPTAAAIDPASSTWTIIAFRS